MQVQVAIWGFALMSAAALLNILLGSLLASKGHDSGHDSEHRHNEGGVVTREHDKVVGVHNVNPLTHGAVPVRHYDTATTTETPRLAGTAAHPNTRAQDQHIV
jgi:hypothetical protein